MPVYAPVIFGLNNQLFLLVKALVIFGLNNQLFLLVKSSARLLGKDTLR